jgi:type IV pilus assembly protein PilV
MLTRRTTLISPDTRLRAFSLVEVLIALIVLSVGMLGIAGLYVHSMQAGRTSLFRHHAVTLAGDVADRIRANPKAGIAYVDTGPEAGTDEYGCVAGVSNCTREQMAAQDKFLWDRQAQATLPEGDVIVSYDNGVVPAMYTVIISWQEAGYEQNPSYAISFPIFEM